MCGASSKSTLPALGARKPANTLSRVDFPHPLGPSRATNSPAEMLSETSSTAACSHLLKRTLTRSSLRRDLASCAVPCGKPLLDRSRTEFGMSGRTASFGASIVVAAGSCHAAIGCALTSVSEAEMACRVPVRAPQADTNPAERDYRHADSSAHARDGIPR